MKKDMHDFCGMIIFKVPQNGFLHFPRLFNHSLLHVVDGTIMVSNKRPNLW